MSGALIDKVVIASNNPGKLREIGEMLAPLGIDAVPQSMLGVTEADEPHRTFVENALAKARHASLATGLPALADDSGICVDALDGAPGVRSARFAGEPLSDARNNRYLLEALSGAPDRRAHYCCVMVLTRSARDAEPLIGVGEWYGEILREPRGSGGFGYDPLFLDPALGKTGAELSAEQKNRVSHRAKALRELFAKLSAQAARLR
ncbi:MAG: RdgB/HAM1 family non-canonical purine NTP pyrophosphatase [Burkholderiales bacterium]